MNRFPTGLRTAIVTGLLAAGAHAHLAEQTKLLPSDGAPGDQFGTSVAIDGTIAVVGSPQHMVGGVPGAAYVFTRTTATSWPQTAKIQSPGAGAVDLFGASVAISRNYLAVGAPKASGDTGAVHIYMSVGNGWLPVQAVLASDAAPGQLFGTTMDMENDTLVVGVPDNEAAYVFREVAGVWSEEQKITIPAGVVGDRFGTSVSLFGDELVVGAPFDDIDAVDAGSAYLFTRSGTTWTQSLRLGSLTPGAGDGFGHGAGIGSWFIGVGAPFDDDFATDGGVVHYFRRNGASWISEGILSAPAAPVAAGDHVGEQVWTDTNMFLSSQADGDLQGLSSGGAQTFVERVGAFNGDVMFPTDTVDGDELGRSTSMSGCWMIAGAPGDDDMGENSGSAYIFQAALYTQFYCIPGISANGCAATLSTTGTASASESSGFTVFADGMEGGINGLFYYGLNGPQQTSWGNGTSFQCVVPPVRRMGLLTSAGTPGECGGRFAQDFNAVWCSTCPKPLKNPGAGTEINVQLWYRDPGNTSNQSTSLSNGASIGVCP